MSRFQKTLVACGLAATFVFGVSALLVETWAAGPCRCPMIYAPVVCAKGKTYPNQCVADCHNAKDCVPTSPI